MVSFSFSALRGFHTWLFLMEKLKLLFSMVP